ncbi:hypothetical protein [Herpetosiphon llansteffanensis]|uniref:hypothetical protein n=1 Tax=Herpetosiphon llansteffanensis TaxID=2094568 RepID=UPI000D7C11A5|nr:hypothetical protein [Herpetosiphon llansteffanensis]
MIDRFWQVLDLDPITWRNIGRFIEVGKYFQAALPGEHGLYVLHDGQQILRAVDSNNQVQREITGQLATTPQALAEELASEGRWDRVHVISKQHLAEVARQAQQPEQRGLSMPAYYHLVYSLLWGDGQGYVTVPPPAGHWNHWSYAGIEQFIAQLGAEAGLALCVFDAEQLAIGLIAEVRNGNVAYVTTFDAYAAEAVPTLSAHGLEHVLKLLEQRGVPAGAALLCSRAAFEDWLIAPDKLASLQHAAVANEAWWWLREPL